MVGVGDRVRGVVVLRSEGEGAVSSAVVGSEAVAEGDIAGPGPGTGTDDGAVSPADASDVPSSSMRTSGTGSSLGEARWFDSRGEHGRGGWEGADDDVGGLGGGSPSTFILPAADTSGTSDTADSRATSDTSRATRDACEGSTSANRPRTATPTASVASSVTAASLAASSGEKPPSPFGPPPLRSPKPSSFASGSTTSASLPLVRLAVVATRCSRR